MLKIRGVTKRLLALAVVFAMTCSVIPPQNAKATEADQPKQTETGGSAVTTQDESDSPTGTESLPAGETEEASADTAVSENAETPAVQYVYVENAYQVTPGVQNIAVSFQEGIALTNAVLTYEKEGTTERSQIAVSEIQQDAALFSIPYSDGSQSGIYRLVRVSAEVNGMSYEIDLGAIGLNIRYGVDQACDTQPDAVIDESTEAAAMSRSAGGAEAEASFLTLDDNGEITENDTLAEAIEAAEDEAAPMGRSGKARTGETASVAKKTDDLVIVLDPGHGGPDPGTVRDDVYEKNLTLKIAGYCRDELKKYKGVTVYMTRDSDVSVSGTSDAAADLDARVNYAKQKKADVLISFHINSAGASAHGAEVYYPNSSYRPDIGSDGKALAQKIQDELVALGLYDRKIKYLNSQNNSTYDDGSIADYYGLIWRSKKAGFPGLIIEHAFISNTDDYNKYLSSDEKLKSLGQADARGIAEHFGLGKEEPAGWILSENRWWYRHSDGSYTTSDWEQINGRWYYFDTSGWMKTGWILLNGARYYLEASGAMATGWRLLDGIWYYLNASGAMATGWTWVNGKCYYLNASGAMAADTWIGNDYVDGSGAWIPGKKKETDRWILSGNRWWYRHGDGSYTTSDWEQINGKWYYFDEAGWMKTGWLLLDGSWYYLDASGARAAGWVFVGGTYYYLDASGVMQVGWLEEGGSKYYLNTQGNSFGAEGSMAVGYREIEGQWYFFNKQRSPMGALYYTGVTPIMGACALGNDVNNVVNKMADQFTKSGKTYPGTALSKGGAPDIHTFCRIIYEEAVTEGVRPEVVFAQAMLETGYLQFGGDVKVGQFNFAGLGATGGGAEGIHFPDVRTGIRAQVQHLKAYASDEPLKQACVDERFKYVVRKSAPYIEWLGIQENPTGKGWAGGKEYGFNMIKNIINPLLS